MSRVSPTPVTDFDFINYLQLMANALRFRVYYACVDDRSIIGQNQSVVKLYRCPITEFYGQGANIVDAQNDAARRAVEYLQIEARYVAYFYC